MSPLPSESSYSPRENNLIILVQLLSACCSLQSVSPQSPIKSSVTPGPLVEFKNLMVLSTFRLRFLSFLKEVLIPNLVKILQNGLLVMNIKKEEIFCIQKNEIRVFTEKVGLWAKYIK
jgi:hypothetical protein